MWAYSSNQAVVNVPNKKSEAELHFVIFYKSTTVIIGGEKHPIFQCWENIYLNVVSSKTYTKGYRGVFNGPYHSTRRVLNF